MGIVAICVGLAVLTGCQTVQGGPERLYTIAEERADARDIELPEYLNAYKATRNEVDRVFFRNEYIARRMYIIDVEYTDYETTLTKERQEFGFASAMVSQGLSTAGAVFTPANTVRTLSALAGGVNASRGFYDSELLLTKTVQIAQGHMRAQRDRIARAILLQKNKTTLEYSLSAALHDLEDYYRAGTITAGLIEAVGVAGQDAQIAAADKAQAQGIPDPGPGRTVLITDPTKPIPTRPRFISPNPAGTTEYEKGLKPSQIADLREFACQPSAKFTDVRGVVLTKLNKLGNRSSVEPPIDEVDFAQVRETLRNFRHQHKPIPCP
ncbi:MAG TPA: hypothetical protein VN941_03885 [Bradyrhizobium sp.]|nr:hypothetical protein [Bradyrhizobium sp.]